MRNWLTLREARATAEARVGELEERLRRQDSRHPYALRRLSSPRTLSIPGGEETLHATVVVWEDHYAEAGCRQGTGSAQSI